MRLTLAFGSPTTRSARAPTRFFTSAASAPSVVSGMVNRCEPGAVSYFASSPSSRALPTYGEVRTLIVHVVVHPEDHDVVPGQEIDLLLVERVAADDG